MSYYYQVIDGKNMDAHLLELAKEAVAGAEDGRISQADAQQLLKAVKDSGAYTETEQFTMEYIRTNFKWTDSADEWFRTEISSWVSVK
jgi:hypothetical protein